METEKLLESWRISKQKTLVFEGLNPKLALPLLRERASILRLLFEGGVGQIKGEPFETKILLREIEDFISHSKGVESHKQEVTSLATTFRSCSPIIAPNPDRLIPIIE